MGTIDTYMGPIDTNEFIDKAREAGIPDIGICQAGTVPASLQDYYASYLQQGRHAQMHYLENHLEKRLDPRLLMDNAHSIIAAVFPYFPRREWNTNPHIALYAQGKDYHKVVKEKLFSLAQQLLPQSNRCFCDTAPVFEKYWAVQCGLGHIGRNTLLLHPRLGSFCFIGIILTEARFSHYHQPLPHSTPIFRFPEGHPCHDCTRCIQACPGKALDAGGPDAGMGLDARRCFSYLTIEHKGPRPPIPSRYWYGCDICQNVCPANRFLWPNRDRADEDGKQTAPSSGHTTESSPDCSPEISPDCPSEIPTIEEFQASEATLHLRPETIRNMEKQEFRKVFKDSAMERAGIEGLKMNVEAWEEGHLP